MKSKNLWLLGRSLILLVIAFIFVFFLTPFVYSSVNMHSNSSQVETDVAPNSVLKGTINISLNNEPFNSLLTAFSSSIKIKDFLDNNEAEYACNSLGCEKTYNKSSIVNSFELKSGQNRLIGFELKSNNLVSEIVSVSFDLNSNVQESCSNPLIIDFLNDNTTNWKAHKTSLTACQEESYGCYKASDKEGNTPLDTKEYCSRIEVKGPAAGIRIGADLQGIGETEVILRTYDSEENIKECTSSLLASGKVSCIINSTIEKSENFTVCISSSALDSGKYDLSYEEKNTCGYVDDPSNAFDFSIFAQPLKYAQIGKVTLDSNEISNPDFSDLDNEALEDYMSTYLSSIYENNCSKGCIIPIKISSYQDQQIILSNISFIYSAGINKMENNLYDLIITDPVLYMPYTVLDLSKSGLKIPSTPGNVTLVLKLGETKLIEKKLIILALPVIQSIIPVKAIAGVNTLFRVNALGSGISRFVWDFGDGSETTESSSNQAYHKYLEVGTFFINVSATNSFGENSGSFEIKAESPEDYLSGFLNRSKKDLNNINSNMSKFSSFVKSYLERILNTQNMEQELNRLQTEFDAAGGDSAKYIELSEELYALNIPSSVYSNGKSTVSFIFDRDSIDLTPFEQLGLGQVEGNAEEYRDAIFSWFSSNIESTAEQEKYSLILDGVPYYVATRFKLSISPKNDLDKIYLIIKSKKEDLDLSGSFEIKEAGDYTGVILSDLSYSNPSEIEFILKGDKDILENPFYFSPDLAYLDAALGIITCNNNGICEKDKGESYENCRKDCKPFEKITKYIIILVIIFFVIYIALQEWYKRRYEKHLFKNSDDLFNIINFFVNGEKQGLSFKDMKEKLMEKDWDGENIDYAWRKYKGKRTGMYEIPLFKWVENKKVKEEIQKRQSLNSGNRFKQINAKQNINK